MSLDASRMKVQTNILNAFCRPTTYLGRKNGKTSSKYLLRFLLEDSTRVPVLKLPALALSQKKEKNFQAINKSYDFCSLPSRQYHKKWAPAKMKNALWRFLKREN